MKSRWQQSSKQVGIDSDGGGASVGAWSTGKGGKGCMENQGGTRLALTGCRAYLSANLYLGAYVPPFKHSGQPMKVERVKYNGDAPRTCQLVFNL